MDFLNTASAFAFLVSYLLSFFLPFRKATIAFFFFSLDPKMLALLFFFLYSSMLVFIFLPSRKMIWWLSLPKSMLVQAGEEVCPFWVKFLNFHQPYHSNYECVCLYLSPFFSYPWRIYNKTYNLYVTYKSFWWSFN